MKKYWLMKSEPNTYSIDELKKDKKTLWDGVRNYQARNFMTKDMQVGDEVIFYHSNAEPPSVVGLARVCQKAQPDPSAFDKKSKYYDAKSDKTKPRWFCVEIQFKKKFKNSLALEKIKKESKLKNMLLIRKGQRLSIQPVTKTEFEHICKMGDK